MTRASREAQAAQDRKDVIRIMADGRFRNATDVASKLGILRDRASDALNALTRDAVLVRYTVGHRVDFQMPPATAQGEVADMLAPVEEMA